MIDRERAMQVLEAEPDVAPAAKEDGGHPLLNLQRKAGNNAVNRLVQTKLTVGNAGDAYEQEADRVAADVMRRLQTGETGGDIGGAGAPPVQLKSAGDPLGGTAVPGDLERQISSSSGRPMEAGTLTRMSSAFGADFSGVRIHDGAEAGAMNDSLQAEAFTTGSDVFFKPGGYDPASSGGQELLAHELTHVVQQNGGTANRQIRRFVSVDMFKTVSAQGFFTGSSTAQKAIVTKLTAYNKLGTKDKKGSITIPDNKLALALDLLKTMQVACEEWTSAHTLEELNSAGETETTVDPTRLSRATGMKWFLAEVATEQATIQGRLDASSSTQETFVADDKGRLALQQHYSGNLSESLTKIGNLIDKVVPKDGDSTELSIDLQIPVQPGVFVGAIFEFEAEKDGNVEVGLKAAFQAGGSAVVGDVAGALGGYFKASGKTGTDVMKLISYGFYRRCKETNLIPAEMSSLIWGGGTGEFAKKKADKWSLGIEEELLGEKNAEGEDNENFVELGGFGRLSADLDTGSIVDVSAEAELSSGKRYDPTSMKNRKGGAGEKNAKSDSFFTKNVASKVGNRGAEKSTGRGATNLDVSLGAEVLGLTGELAMSLSWRDQGFHADQRKLAETENILLEDAEISLTVGGPMPTDGIEAKLAALAVKVAQVAQEKSQQAASKAAAKKDTPVQTVMKVKGAADAGFIAATGAPLVDWFKAAAGGGKDAAEEGAEAATDSVLDFGSSVGLELGLTLEKKGAGWNLSVELKHVKEKSVELPEILKVELTRKERLGKKTWPSVFSSGTP